MKFIETVKISKKKHFHRIRRTVAAALKSDMFKATLINSVGLAWSKLMDYTSKRCRTRCWSTKKYRSTPSTKKLHFNQFRLTTAAHMRPMFKAILINSVGLACSKLMYYTSKRWRTRIWSHEVYRNSQKFEKKALSSHSSHCSRSI